MEFHRERTQCPVVWIDARDVVALAGGVEANSDLAHMRLGRAPDPILSQLGVHSWRNWFWPKSARHHEWVYNCTFWTPTYVRPSLSFLPDLEICQCLKGANHC